MLVRAPAYCFSVKFSCFRFTKSIKPSKGRWTRFGLSFAVINIIKMILMLHEGRRSPVIIWLCLWFPSICFYEISQNFHNLWNFSNGSFKIRKKSGYRFKILCFLRLSQICSYKQFCLQQSTGITRGTNMFNGPANLRKFHRRKHDKSCSKYPHFLCRKIITFWNRNTPRSISEYT